MGPPGGRGKGGKWYAGLGPLNPGREGNGGKDGGGRVGNGGRKGGEGEEISILGLKLVVPPMAMHSMSVLHSKKLAI